MKQTIFNKTIVALDNRINEVAGLEQGDYDNHAKVYDNLVQNRLYNKIAWANTPDDYTSFCKKAIDNTVEGPIADVGCGSLCFTAQTYATQQKHDLYLCDLSHSMLQHGVERLESYNTSLSHITIVRANALELPFTDGSISTAFSFGLFHILPSANLLVKELHRILKPKGKVYITSLCNDRYISRKWLNMLYKKEKLAKPRSSDKVKQIVAENGISIDSAAVKGGMVYITGTKQ